jgi:hypothetical protein
MTAAVINVSCMDVNEIGSNLLTTANAADFTFIGHILHDIELAKQHESDSGEPDLGNISFEVWYELPEWVKEETLNISICFNYLKSIGYTCTLPENEPGWIYIYWETL